MTVLGFSFSFTLMGYTVSTENSLWKEEEKK